MSRLIKLREGARYTIHADRIGGIVCVRRSDNASLYLQPGDDANAFRADLESYEYNSDTMRRLGLDAADVCIDYDDLFSGGTEG